MFSHKLLPRSFRHDKEYKGYASRPYKTQNNASLILMALFYRRRLSNPLKGYCSLRTSNDALNFLKFMPEGGLPVITHLYLVLDTSDYDDYQDDFYAMALSRFHEKHTLEEVRIIIRGNILFTSDRYLLCSPASASEPETSDKDGCITWRPVFQNLYAFIDNTITRQKTSRLNFRLHKYRKSVVDALLGIRGVASVIIKGPMEHELRESLMATMCADPPAARPADPLRMPHRSLSPSPTPRRTSNPRRVYNEHSNLIGRQEAPPHPTPSSPRTPRPQKRRKLRAGGSGSGGRYVTDTEADSSDEGFGPSPTSLDGTREHQERASPESRRRRDEDGHMDGDTDADADVDESSLEDDASEPEVRHHGELAPGDMVVIAHGKQTVQEFENSEHWLRNVGDWELPTGGAAKVELGWMVDGRGEVVRYRGKAR